MKKAIRKLFVHLFARKLFQSFFKKLHWLSLRGMNYGGGHSPYNSGEMYLLNHIKRKTNKNLTILDIGANTGQYALMANKIFNSTCTIYSFEPAEFTYSLLLKNTKNTDNIVAINKGVGESSGKTQIYYDGKASVQSSLIRDSIQKYSETIELTTIDEFIKENKIDKIDLLKLDVEGYEYKALLGGSESINDINYIQFEFGNKQVLSRNFMIDFITLLDNFKIYRLIQNGFIEINRNPINEIFQTSNYIAINNNIQDF